MKKKNPDRSIHRELSVSENIPCETRKKVMRKSGLTSAMETSCQGKRMSITPGEMRDAVSDT